MFLPVIAWVFSIVVALFIELIEELFGKKTSNRLPNNT